jgi:uncharacterized membrane protein
MVRTRDLATGGIVTLIAAAGVVYAPRLPEELAVHFDTAGEPNSYMAKDVFLVGSVLFAAGFAALFAVLPRVDPLGENFAEFQDVYDGFVVVLLALLAYIYGLVLAYNLGFEFGMLEATAPAMAVLYVLLGLLLWRAEQNWFVGVRTPWTLSDERVWDQTHRHTAPLFVVAGVVALGAVSFSDYAMVLLVGPVTLIALWSVLYSFILYRGLDHA